MPVMHTPPRHRRRMGGFALMQLSILLAVLSILGVVAAQQLINELDELQAEAAGSYAQSIKNALDQYLTENQLALHNNLPVTGFADPLAPTVQELRNAKYLYSSFPLVDPMRRRYAAQIRRIACPGPGCEVSALAFVNMPLTQRCTGFAADGACTATAGEVKHRIVEAIRSHSRGYGAAVTLLAPDRYRGSVCDYATPTGAAVGTYGVCTSDNAAIYAQFVRIGACHFPLGNDTHHAADCSHSQAGWRERAGQAMGWISVGIGRLAGRPKAEVQRPCIYSGEGIAPSTCSA